MKEVVIRSFLNADGYEFEGKTYILGTPQVQELRDKLRGQKVKFVSGKNTFTGEPVSDKFVARMIDCLK